MGDIPVFRPPKRRKVPKPRVERDEPAPLQKETSNSLGSEDPGDEDSSVLVRAQRRPHMHKTGLSFSASRPPPTTSDPLPLVASDVPADKPNHIPSRFIGASEFTTRAVDVDKHMMAYVDSQLSHRNTLVPPSSTSTQATPNTEAEISASKDQYQPTPSVSTSALPPSQNHYQLSEVDLGPPQPPPSPPLPKRPKPRLGRDGKPFIPRPRRRRPSTDLARDALVEQVLHEHRLEPACAPVPTTNTATSTGSTPAQGPRDPVESDEAFAARFRADFLSQASERQAREDAKRSQAKTKTATAEEKGGPRLGGSRAARAKMAQSQQSAGQK